jgi:uncharacterized protein YbjT (DUF2867 family)
MSSQKLILVIGATGAQGVAVIDALLAPDGDGTSSSYSVRALTRDPLSRRAQELTAKGVECVKGVSKSHLVLLWLITLTDTALRRVRRPYIR